MLNSSSSEEHGVYTCAGTYVWAFFSTLCFVVGFPPSLFILWEMFRTHSGGAALTPNDFFILNLSTMDAAFLLLVIPGIMNYFLWRNWVFEAVWNGFYALSICGRPFMMACSCLDCYMAVVHPIIYHQRRSLTPRVVMAAVVWTLTLASGFAYAFMKSLTMSFFPAVTLLIAFIIIVVCDGFILQSLLQSDPSRRNIHPQKQRAILTLISSLSMAVVSYLIPTICFTVGKVLISDAQFLLCTVATLFIITSTLGSAVMPWFFLGNIGRLDCFRSTICKS